MKQATALAILQTGQNVFLTGQAGAGKTYVLNQYIDYLRVRGVPVAITASTGIAATHMNGMTIHSWSGIGIHNELEKVNLAKLQAREDFVERLKKTKVLIIDEISMLHAKQVDTIDGVLKHFRDSQLPFGGMQVIFSGDFFQLPPIGEKGETSKEKYAFMSQAWLACQFQICYLTEQHRQAGAGERETFGLSLNDILNQIRSQTVTKQAVDVLQATENHTIDLNRTRLYTHNADVDTINQRQLQQLPTKPITYQAATMGEKPLQEALTKSVRAPSELTVAIGAKVMFVKNLPLLGVYNGTMGEVIGFVGSSGKRYTQQTESNMDEKAYPLVRLNGGGELVAEPEEWTIEDKDGMVLASFTQVPLCLAWAITVHKSQGMTLDAAEIDLSKTFEMGQGYVALSRLRSLAGLKLLGFNLKSLLLDEWVQRVDLRFIELSKEHEAKFNSLDDKALAEIHRAFIQVCDGITDEKVIAENLKYLTEKRQAKQAKSAESKSATVLQNGLTATVNETFDCVQAGLDLQQIAKKRSLAVSTIITHLAAIAKAMGIGAIEQFCPEQSVLDEIAAAIQRLQAQGELLDDIKITPIFDELREKYPHNEIRLALPFIIQADDKDGADDEA
ncbi:PIF1-like helicase [Moraxella cuniculi DSM 21768]|uniref:PIF1-like helicase n=1 Tax=Moraxella cuniculi DSM 21768 TaxID=1122245 RepID=A0A1N7ERG8_9GAMM|nr:helix-turn-helix domain-containing protein [Moraxella cuniculi]OOS06299.1 helicase [Moraxella cuniculi]SIR90708.1 PIF1-like helicase [Moraxella cuniculi DSM 21768]